MIPSMFPAMDNIPLKYHYVHNAYIPYDFEDSKNIQNPCPCKAVGDEYEKIKL